MEKDRFDNTAVLLWHSQDSLHRPYAAKRLGVVCEGSSLKNLTLAINHAGETLALQEFPEIDLKGANKCNETLSIHDLEPKKLLPLKKKIALWMKMWRIL